MFAKNEEQNDHWFEMLLSSFLIEFFAEIQTYGYLSNMKYILNRYVGGSSPAAPPNQQRIRKIKKISIFSKIDQFAHLL